MDEKNREKLERLRNIVWTTKDGKKIKIRDMESSHIKNCINQLNRRFYKMDYDAINMIKIFNLELKIREEQKKMIEDAWLDVIR